VPFGTELLFVFVLGFLLLGPKRLPALLEHIARARTQLHDVTQSFRSQLDTAAETHRDEERMYTHAQPGGE
jgi:Sec-independent protein translocase protein TatA